MMSRDGLLFGRISGQPGTQSKTDNQFLPPLSCGVVINSAFARKNCASHSFISTATSATLRMISNGLSLDVTKQLPHLGLQRR